MLRVTALLATSAGPRPVRTDGRRPGRGTAPWNISPRPIVDPPNLADASIGDSTEAIQQTVHTLATRLRNIMTRTLY
jgi:hypothetical protein